MGAVRQETQRVSPVDETSRNSWANSLCSDKQRPHASRTRGLSSSWMAAVQPSRRLSSKAQSGHVQPLRIAINPLPGRISEKDSIREGFAQRAELGLALPERGLDVFVLDVLLVQRVDVFGHFAFDGFVQQAAVRPG
jgi:hypothetical protein